MAFTVLQSRGQFSPAALGLLLWWSSGAGDALHRDLAFYPLRSQHCPSCSWGREGRVTLAHGSFALHSIQGCSDHGGCWLHTARACVALAEATLLTGHFCMWIGSVAVKWTFLTPMKPSCLPETLWFAELGSQTFFFCKHLLSKAAVSGCVTTNGRRAETCPSICGWICPAAPAADSPVLLDLSLLLVTCVQNQYSWDPHLRSKKIIRKWKLAPYIAMVS